MGRGVKETGYVSDVDFVVNTVRVNKVSLENVGLCRNCVGDGKGSMSKGLKVLSINVKVKGLLINVTKDIQAKETETNRLYVVVHSSGVGQGLEVTEDGRTNVGDEGNLLIDNAYASTDLTKRGDSGLVVVLIVKDGDED